LSSFLFFCLCFCFCSTMSLSSRRMNGLKSKFARLDKDGDGKLSFHEAQELHRSRHIGASLETIKQEFEAADLNSDGFLNFREFMSLETSQVGQDCHKDNGGECQDSDLKVSADDCPDPIQDEYSIHDGETLEHWMQRVEDEHPHSVKRQSPFRHTATQILELQRERQDRQALPPIAPKSAPSSGQVRRPKVRRLSEPGASRQHRERFFDDRNLWTGTQASMRPKRSKSKHAVHGVLALADFDEVLQNFKCPSWSKGPERLFYDTNSYTGVSKHGCIKRLPQL